MLAGQSLLNYTNIRCYKWLLIMNWKVLRVIMVFAAISNEIQAQIYQCIDPETGNRTFSDTACPDKSRGKAISVSPTNSSDSPFENDAHRARVERERAVQNAAFRQGWQDQVESVDRQQQIEESQRNAQARRKQADWDNRCSKRGAASDCVDYVRDGRGNDIHSYSRSKFEK